jgi:hypothetical protein
MQPMTVAGVGAAAAVVALTLAEVWVALGAHDFWAAKAGYAGAALGLAGVLGLAGMPVSQGLRLGLAVLVLAGSGAAAYFGKLAFVASYAEDQLAGKLWFFGWFGVTAGIVMVAAALAGLRRPPA